MHCIGFHHEFCRKDHGNHCTINRANEKGFVLNTISFGQFDYRSIMQYPARWPVIDVNKDNDEYKDTALNTSIVKTFSICDIAGIRRIYGKRDKLNKNDLVHFGEWHKACSDSRCDNVSCYCGNCGAIKIDDSNGIVSLNCGWTGYNTKGHWTCCFKTKRKDRACGTTHSGYYHMQCTKSSCTNRKCNCNSCGMGCTYKTYANNGNGGKKGHWSCCNVEEFNSKCPVSPYQ